MLKIDTFTCNPISVNTYLIYDETKQALLIDPGFASVGEFSKFKKYIDDNGIEIKRCFITHPHPDHLAGGRYIVENFSVIPEMHPKGERLFNVAVAWGSTIGFDDMETFETQYSLEGNVEIKVGNTVWSVIYTPGHAEGSVCIYCKDSGVLFSGDLLFRGGVGRTDMPTGSFEILTDSIENKIFVLPDDVVVYPGHGDRTKVGYEKNTNPFFG